MTTGRNDPCPCGSGRKFKQCCLHSGTDGHPEGQRGGAVDRSILLALFQQGRHAELEGVLTRLLSGNRGSAFLWALLGTSQELQGKDGLEALKRATVLDPLDVDANISFGVALRNRGEFISAAALFTKALSRQPDSLAARFNLGENWRLAGEYEKSATILRALVGEQPQFVDALVSFADVLGAMGGVEEAETWCRRALKIDPAFALACFCLGNLLRKQNRLEEARAAYVDAINADSGFVAAYDNLGCVLQELGLLAEAERYFREALKIAPGNTNVLLNLGRILDESGRYSEAESVYRSALCLYPDHSVLLERLGNVLHVLGLDDDAAGYLDKAILSNAESIRLRFARMMLSLPSVVKSEQASEAVPESFSRALEHLAGALEAADKRLPDVAELAEMPMPFALAYRQGNLCRLLSRFADVYSQLFEAQDLPPALPRARIRLLVISHHVRRHSVWDVVLRGLLIHLDRTRFELLVYHLGNSVDEETEAARAMSDLWRDRATTSTPEAWLAAVRADCPDVIFYPEVGMSSLSYMLAAHRLAPLQVAGWGHPVTTGLPTIDLYFSGALLEPENAQEAYRERLILLPGTGCCTDVPADHPDSIDDLLPLIGGNERTRFVIAQRAIKLDPADDRLIAEIAANTPGSVVILFQDPVAPWITEVVIDRLRQCFVDHGANPDHQLVVLPWQNAGRFLGLLNVCDVYLDCPAFSGYTTAWQAVHQGIPVVTLEGEQLRQRLATGLLKKIGLPETIAHSPEEYVQLATDVGKAMQSPEMRSRQREKVRYSARQADGDVSVVRAFEAALLAELGRS